MAPENVLLAGLVVLTSAAAVHDSRSGLIPNRLLAWGAGLGLAAHLVVGGWSGGPSGVGASACAAVLGLFACALVPLLLYRAGGIGGGDVKLLAVIGLLLGPMLGLEAELEAFVALLLYAPARLAYEGRLLRALANAMALAANPLLPKAKRREVPPELMTSFRFGPAIFLGSLLVALMHWRVA